MMPTLKQRPDLRNVADNEYHPHLDSGLVSLLFVRLER